MATGSFSSSERVLVAVNPQSELPKRPAVTGPLAAWLSTVIITLRNQIGRFGFAINANSLAADQDRTRSRFRG